MAVCDTTLQTALLRSLGAQMEDGADVTLDNFTERRVVFSGVIFFFPIDWVRLHNLPSLRISFR